MKKRYQKPAFNPKIITSCDRKRHFKTEQDALDAAELRMLDNMTITIGVYECSICHHWHLTRIKDTTNSHDAIR
jgi:hypothetical protein